MKSKKMLLISAMAILSISSVTACGKHTHKFGTDWKNDATNHWHACDGCDEVDGLAEHDFVSAVTTQPTYENAGVKTFQCTVCGYQKTEEIAKLEHHYLESWEYDDEHHWHECTDTGYESLHIAEAEHDLEVTDRLDPTASADGYEVYECSVCDYSTNVTLPKITNSWVIKAPETYGDAPTISLMDNYGNYGKVTYEEQEYEFKDVSAEYLADDGVSTIKKYTVRNTVVPCLGDFNATYSASKLEVIAIIKAQFSLTLVASKSIVESCWVGEITDSKDFNKVPHDLKHFEQADGSCITEGQIERYECSICEKSYTDESCTTELTEELDSFMLSGYFEKGDNFFYGSISYGQIKEDDTVKICVGNKKYLEATIDTIKVYQSGSFVTVPVANAYDFVHIYIKETVNDYDFPEYGVTISDLDNLGHVDFDENIGMCLECNDTAGNEYNSYDYSEGYYAGTKGWNVDVALSKYNTVTYIPYFEIYNGEYFAINNDSSDITKMELIDANGNVVSNNDIVHKVSYRNNWVVDLYNYPIEEEVVTLKITYKQLTTSSVAHFSIVYSIDTHFDASNWNITIAGKTLPVAGDDGINSIDYLSDHMLVRYIEDGGPDTSAYSWAEYMFVDEGENTGYIATMYAVVDGESIAIATSVCDYMSNNWSIDPNDSNYRIYEFNFISNVSGWTDSEGVFCHRGGDFEIRISIIGVDFDD